MRKSLSLFRTILALSTALVGCLFFPGMIWAHGGEEHGNNPAVVIVGPRTGETIAAAGAKVVVEVENFRLSGENVGRQPAEGEGHLHLVLDGKTIEVSDPETPLAGLEPGAHVLEVHLVNNNHAPVFPRAFSAVQFQVEEPTPLERAQRWALPMAAAGLVLLAGALGLLVARRRTAGSSGERETR